MIVVDNFFNILVSKKVLNLGFVKSIKNIVLISVKNHNVKKDVKILSK
jgi:hypothetical protein